MKKKIKLTILSLGLFLFVLNFFFWITDIIAGKKGIESLSIIYSSVGNEEWLGFWGNVISGILPLIIIFHYQEESKKQQEQFKLQLKFQEEESKKQQEQFKLQLKFQEEQQYQSFLIEKLNKEEQITKNVLKTWDNSIFDNLSDLIVNHYKYLLYENYKYLSCKNSTDKKDRETEYLNFLNKYNKEKNKIISIFNYGMLEIDLLPWRLNNTKENLENSHIQINTYHKLKKDCYESFKILHDKISKDCFPFFAEQCEILSKLNESKIEKNFNEFNKKREKLLSEYSDLYIDTINNISSYFYSCSQYIQNKNFEIFEDKTFFKKEEEK